MSRRLPNMTVDQALAVITAHGAVDGDHGKTYADPDGDADALYRRYRADPEIAAEARNEPVDQQMPTHNTRDVIGG